MDINQVFSSFSVKDLTGASKFYSEVLELKVERDDTMGLLRVSLPDNSLLVIYPKDNHVPAEFTVLNLVVSDIDVAVNTLSDKGVTFETYEGFGQDDKGIARASDDNPGPSIAWFKDPDGNTISVLESPDTKK